MKVFLYKRVSTDEQSLGFSLRDQDIRLNEFCFRAGDEVVGSYEDDYTGKTFNRPDFNRMMADLSTKRPDRIYFVKWTRFSRDTTDGLAMIRLLKKKGVQVNAIDEWIDWSATHAKLMAAMFIASGEVDNDMRSDATARGMRRANKEGRYICSAPYGYNNQRDSLDKPIIVPDEFKAPLVKKAFELMGTGLYSQEQVRKIVNDQGLKFSKTQFSISLQNPIYCGLIRVRPYKDEPAEIVKGIHEPLISESLFYTVQEVLTGKRRVKSRVHKKLKEQFPLVGFLHCQHDHKMTCSCSRGKMGTYYGYYHCWNNLHCIRGSAEAVNQSFIEEGILNIKVDSSRVEDYRMILDYLNKPDASKLNAVKAKITEQENRIAILQDKFVVGHIQLPDYQQIRARYEMELTSLKERLALLMYRDSDSEGNLNNGILLLSDLYAYYKESDAEGKQSILSSIIDGKIHFDGKKCRTPKYKPAVSLLCNTGAGFSMKETLGQSLISGNVPYGDPDGTLSRTPKLIQLGIKSLSETYKMLVA